MGDNSGRLGDASLRRGGGRFRGARLTPAAAKIERSAVCRPRQAKPAAVAGRVGQDGDGPAVPTRHKAERRAEKDVEIGGGHWLAGSTRRVRAGGMRALERD